MKNLQTSVEYKTNDKKLIVTIPNDKNKEELG